MMRRAWRCLLLAVAVALAGVPANAAERAPARWADDSALTTPAHRLEVGVFSQSSYGVSDRLELETHPLAFFVLPQVHAKWRWLDGEVWHLSSRHGISYPTPFLNLIAKEGTGGLLPATTEVPQALLLHSSAVLTARLAYDHWLTLESGAIVGPREHTTVLVDFPYLYARLAALNAPLVPHGAFSAHGTLISSLDYRARSKLSLLLLDEVDGAFDWESSAELGWSFSDRLRVSASVAVELAQFPVGRDWYWLPLADLRMAW